MMKNRWTVVGPNVYLASAYTSLAAAVAAAGNMSEILLTDGYTTTLNAPLLLNGQGVTLRCAPGALIAKGFSGDAIQITGQNVTIEGCTLDGARNSYSGGLITIKQQTRGTGSRVDRFWSGGNRHSDLQL